MKSCLVPFADMANHDGNKRNVDWSFDPVRGGYSLKAHTDINRGQEVCISYGDGKLMSVMFLSYGFLETNGENNNVIMPLYLKKESSSF